MARRYERIRCLLTHRSNLFPIFTFRFPSLFPTVVVPHCKQKHDAVSLALRRLINARNHASGFGWGHVEPPTMGVPQGQTCWAPTKRWPAQGPWGQAWLTHQGLGSAFPAPGRAQHLQQQGGSPRGHSHQLSPGQGSTLAPPCVHGEIHHMTLLRWGALCCPLVCPENVPKDFRE